MTNQDLIDPQLTQVIVMPGGKRIPLMMEVPVSTDLDGPFLLCSSKGFLWVERASNNSMVRTAIRVVNREELFETAVRLISKMAVEREWGSVQPKTPEGVSAAFSHLADYDIIDVEVVYGGDFDPAILPKDVLSSKATWMPSGWAAVLPIDRSFLGTLFEYAGDQYGMVFHNSPRGIAVIKDE